MVDDFQDLGDMGNEMKRRLKLTILLLVGMWLYKVMGCDYKELPITRSYNNLLPGHIHLTKRVSFYACYTRMNEDMMHAP
ncbi:hypothetical protein C5167_050866 [Papaver somniferum]|uniref:Uncharacterized protein n=1 Tax=Papaver somniferum TaxID=3469 RepID=A0A4Y7KPU5_PAPSO|nr:hypothetical protein C5167_050866 [Papaver somniferum]